MELTSLRLSQLLHSRPSTIRSAKEMLVSDSDLIFSSAEITTSVPLFTSQSFCGARRILAPFAPPLLSDPLNVAADAHAVVTSCAVVRPLESILLF